MCTSVRTLAPGRCAKESGNTERKTCINFTVVACRLAVIEDLLQVPGELITDDARAGARELIYEIREAITTQTR